MGQIKYQLAIALFILSGAIRPISVMADGSVICANNQPCSAKQMQMKSDKVQQGAQDAMALGGNTTMWVSDSTGSSCYQIQNTTPNLMWVPNLNSTVAGAVSDFKNLVKNDKTCSSSPICVQSVAPALCGSTPNPVNGSCGSANGSTYADATAMGAAPLCGSGTPSTTTFSGSGPWSWVCTGTNGGSNSNSCTASAVGNNGICGAADGQYFDDIGSVTIAGLCNAGTATTVGNKPNGKPWGWTCKGSSGGTDAACSAIPGKTHGCQCFCTPSDGSSNWIAAGTWPDTNGNCNNVNCPCTGNDDEEYFSCGAANGNSYSSLSALNSAGLCGGNTSVEVNPYLGKSAPSGNGPWTWSCKVNFSNQGRSVDCGAKQGP